MPVEEAVTSSETMIVAQLTPTSAAGCQQCDKSTKVKTWKITFYNKAASEYVDKSEAKLFSQWDIHIGPI